MHSALLLLHSILRWAVLILALIALARAIGGVIGRREWTAADLSIGGWFVGSLDLQTLIGLVLYVIFLSRLIGEGDMAGVMRNAPLRFFAVEHITGMIIAVALAHVGRAKTKKATEAAQRHRTALIFYALALVVIVLSIPWPGTPGDRPLLRGLEQTASL